MRYTISYKTILRRRTLLKEHLQPTPGIVKVTEVMKMGHEVTKLTLQRNFLKNMWRSGIATTEEINSARDNVGLSKEDKSQRGVKQDTLRLIGLRLSARNRELNACRKTWLERKKQLEKRILPNWKEEFSEITKAEGKRIWETENRRLEEKLNNLRRTRDLPTKVEGINLLKRN